MIMCPPQRQPFIAGIYLLMSVDTVILPGKRGMFGVFCQAQRYEIYLNRAVHRVSAGIIKK